MGAGRLGVKHPDRSEPDRKPVVATRLFDSATVIILDTMKRVLVVDDERDIREAIAEALETEGYEVAAAANGMEALSRLREYHPDVVLLDLMMPIMNGWQFRARQKEDPQVSEIPVIVVTAMGHEPTIDADKYIQKPFDLDELITAVSSCSNAAA